MKVSKEDLILDLKRVSDGCIDTGVTRNYYRAKGNYREQDWQKHFATFGDFCRAAEVNEPTMKSTVEGDNWNVFIPYAEGCNPQELIKQLGIDTQVWELERFRAKDIERDGTTKYQISAFFKKRTDILAIQGEIEDLKNKAKADLGRKIAPIKYSITPTGNMLEINIADHHFGKLAWPLETGHEPYDIQIAEAMFMRALDVLLSRVKGYSFDQVLFVVGNDLLNSDNAGNETTGGTVVTTDTRYHKTFRVVRNTMIAAIERLKQIAPVKVLIIPGNHDALASYHLGDSLECWFHCDKDVIVENQPRTRKYHEFGKVMLAFIHGDEGVRTDYPLLIATEQPEMFGRTKFREVHTGHTHQDKVSEMHGVKVRILSALCPPDDWHAVKGFVGNLRSAEAFIWNKEEGLIATAIYTDNAYPVIETTREIVNIA